MTQPNARGADFWDEVEAVFTAAAGASAEDRTRVLDDLCSARPDIRAEVESLLRAHTDSSGFLSSLDADAGAAANPRVGSRVGAYKLLERVGSGGMGVVFRAERADGDFTHQIAIKIITTSTADAVSSRRFRAERQILAAIQHPNVVTLLDAGITADAHPYLAMEFVDGVPIVRYCREHALPLDQRIALFRQVCDAVQYLHQHAIVHRDLKPANILVTQEGVPKVLDFGIAKLLTDDGAQAADATREAPAMTPNYASPEQVRGLPATAASDVYALGVILYELIAGVRPYDTDGRTLDEVVHTVVDVDAPRPSSATACVPRPPYPLSALRGDLDAVVLRALRKRPEERYASAAALSDDLGRHLSGLPVEARPPSLGYVMTKLARRHKAVFVTTGVSALVIVVLLGAAIREAAVARAQRVRAERRFSEVRRLADTLIFQVEDAVTPLPGSTPVRKMLVTEGLGYLERLRADAAGDFDLQLEIARAYIKIGSVQGRPNNANLGDPSGAVSSFTKAESLLTPFAASPAASMTVVRASVGATAALAETLLNMAGRRAEASAAAGRGIRIAEQYAARHPESDEAKETLGLAYFSAALAEERKESLPFWSRAQDLYSGLLAKRPADAHLRRNVALTEKYMGAEYENEREYASALEHYTRSLALDEQRAGSHPEDRVAALDVAIDLSNVADIHYKRGEYAEAMNVYERSLAIRERLAETDPQDALARGKVAFVRRQLGNVASDAGDSASAIDHFRRAAAIYQTMDLSGLDTKRNLAYVLGELGRLEHDRTKSCADATRAFDLFATLTEPERLIARSPDPLRYVAAIAADCGSAAARSWLRSAAR
jgi:eukaryotic-like serine/threonine-protein kinase